MATVSELMAANITNAQVAQQTWGGIIINVKSYGAIGDGTTNDTAAIQRAVNAAVAAGMDQIVFPAGTYIYDTLTGADDITAVGDGVTLTGDTELTLVSSASLNTEVVALKADTAQLQKRVKNMISVLEYGAVADGDYGAGTGTDNTSAFQDAIDSLSTSGGGCLIIPPGIYKLVSQITVPSGISIIGFGKWTSILFCPTAFSDTTGLILINGTGGNPTNIKGLGVLAQTGGAGGTGIHSTKNGVFLSDIWVNGFNNSGAKGIQIESTDNFITDFVVEICEKGIEITSSHVNIEGGTVYDCTIGLSVANNATVEAGEVTVVNVRANACAQKGFDVSAGKNVTFSACSAVNEDSTKFSVAGININTASNVKVIEFVARIDNEDHTSGVGIKVVSSSNVSITGGMVTNLYDGVNVSNTTNVTINGIQTLSNARHGVIVDGGDGALVNAVISKDNGGSGTADSGIYLNNTAAFGIYSVSNCVCSQAGGGPQEYGIYLNLTDNGASSGVINVVGNTCQHNATDQISRNGKTLNITDTGNIAA